MLQLCRGLQALFHETRDRTIHIVTLMKILVKYCEENKKDSWDHTKPSCPLKDLRVRNIKSLNKLYVFIFIALIPTFHYDVQCQTLINFYLIVTVIMRIFSLT